MPAATRRCNEKYAVVLTAQQRAELLELTRNGSGAGAKKIAHARVLLMADRDHPDGRRTDAQIAAALGLHVNTVADVRKRSALRGLAPALDRKRRAAPPTPAKIDGRAEAHLVAICCSPAPAGHARWTLRMLADEMGRRGVVVSVCAEAVRKALKKTSCVPG